MALLAKIHPEWRAGGPLMASFGLPKMFRPHSRVIPTGTGHRKAMVRAVEGTWRYKRLAHLYALCKGRTQTLAAGGPFKPFFGLSGAFPACGPRQVVFDNRILWLTTPSTPDKLIN
jgi:hypothetical protein